MHFPKRGGPIAVLYCSTGGGHLSSARAIAEAAHRRGLRAELIDALAYTPPWFAGAYVNAHYGTSSLAPSLYGAAYDASNHRSGAENPVRRVFDRCLGARLLMTLQRMSPAAIVSTHFYPPAVLQPAIRSGALGVPVVGVVTDYAAHALWAEPGLSAYCVPRGWAGPDLAGHGVMQARIYETGIPIRSEFGRLPRARSGHVTTRVLLTSGGHAIGPVGQVLRSFSCVPGVSVTLVCGKNERMVARMRRLSARHQIDARVLGYERDMPARMGEADVVVGKPGGLTVSECLAAGRPLIMVGAVPGQETRNQAWLCCNDAGIAVRGAAVGRTVAALRDVGALEAMAQNARVLGAPDAAERVLDVALACAAQNDLVRRRSA